MQSNPFRWSFRSQFLLGFLLCAGLIGFALFSQFQWDLLPCPLCIFQRLLDMVIGGLGLLGFALPSARLLWAGLIGVLATLGTGVAAYQTWMQAYPHLAPECSLTDPNAIERLVDWLGMQLPSLFLATGFCTSREWEFLSMSMANWSALFFAGIVGYAILLFRSNSQA